MLLLKQKWSAPEGESTGLWNDTCACASVRFVESWEEIVLHWELRRLFCISYYCVIYAYNMNQQDAPFTINL
jgi:hypothetical protein